MIEKKRRRIQVGLLLGHLEDEFDATVAQGAMEAAVDNDVNLVLMPGRYIKGVYKDTIATAYEYQYHTLFDIPTAVKFDVLLVLIGTLGGHLSKEEQKEFLKKYEGTPIITITSEVEGYPCLMIDNNKGMGDAVRHLITEHNCKKIGYVSGPVTNDDAQARLSIYKNVLEENGIEYDENRVVYGNFSRYIEKNVEDLLDRNKDLDAVVFANDQMAYAGYQVFEKRCLRPGRDIFVTGFDDDPICMELTPHLTTVKADSRELGYQAIVEAVNYVLEGELENNLIQSHLIVRESCGCRDYDVDEKNLRDSIDKQPEAMVDYLCEYLFGMDHFSEIQRQICRRGLEDISTSSVEDILENDGHMANIAMKEVIRWVREGRIEASKFYTVLEILHVKTLEKAGSTLQAASLDRMFAKFFREIAEFNDSIGVKRSEQNELLTLQTSAITKDMLVFDTFDDRAFLSVIEKFVKLNVKTSYLYSYDGVITYTKDKEWKYPDKILLKAYSDSYSAHVVAQSQQKIPFENILSNDFIPVGRRVTMVANALFTNEEQYGLLLCELEPSQFNFLQAVSFQLGAALKIISLVRKQELIERQLRSSLIEVRENNQLLNELSKIDELTGLFNRRGIYEGIRKNLNNTEYLDRKAFMIFADLDSLKIINDMFGHEEGDFAIKSAAQILRTSLGADAVIGRLGGDEFAACVFPEDDMSVKLMKEKIEKVIVNFNAENTVDKNYNVHLSVGVYAFKCNEGVEIGELLSHADTLLYEQKRRKTSILK